MKLQNKLTLKELALKIGADLKGNANSGSEIITAIGDIKNGGKGEVTFLSNPLYSKFLPFTKCSAVILTDENLSKCKVAALVTDNPRLALAKLVNLCIKDNQFDPHIHSSVITGENSRISDLALVKANCVIGNNVIIEDNVILEPGIVIGNNCHIKSNAHIYSNVVLYQDVIIGENSIIHANSVIGSDGFGYANDNGNWIKMHHLGGVKIGNNVEIGSNVSIDRGFMDDTIIEDGVIIDNLVQVGHNVVIGSKTAIAGCVAIAGSTKIGKQCMIGGKAAIAGHLEIADNVIITASSGVSRSLTKPGIYSSGLPVKENHTWRKNVARFNLLDEMAKKLRNLEIAFKKETK